MSRPKKRWFCLCSFLVSCRFSLVLVVRLRLGFRFVVFFAVVSLFRVGFQPFVLRLCGWCLPRLSICLRASGIWSLWFCALCSLSASLVRVFVLRVRRGVWVRGFLPPLRSFRACAALALFGLSALLLFFAAGVWLVRLPAFGCLSPLLLKGVTNSENDSNMPEIVVALFSFRTLARGHI